jgi:LCP family protein required for cell wall assembly
MSRKSFYKQSSKVESSAITTTYEVEKPTHFTKSGEGGTKSVIKKSKWAWWAVVSGVLFISISLCCVASIGWWYWHQFETSSGTRLLPLVQNLWKNQSLDLFVEQKYKTFLLLGVDQSSKLRDNSMLTDTMMLAIVRHDGMITMVSLPRDLWIDSLKTKVNALYYYGQQTNPGDGVTLVSSVISEITGVPIDYYFVINMDTMKALVDAVGGVDVEVKRSFVDYEYPREVDLSSSDPAVLYETISFDSGIQHMDGNVALKFIRSRHSKDIFEGTDEGREERQQLLLTTLKKELTQPKIMSNPANMGALYKVFKQSIITNMSDLDLFLIAKEFKNHAISFRTALLPIQDGSQSGLLYHPSKGPSNQWVYMPIDSSWSEVQFWFSKLLL